MLRTDWSAIHRNTGFRLYTIPLAVLSFLYGTGVRVRLKGLKKRAKRLPGFVISIGNLTAGGTGKTPAVLMLARWAKDNGYRAAVLSRGYGGEYSGESEVVTDGRNILVSPKISGDEPWLMANKLEGIPVIVSKKRYTGGSRAYKSFGSNFFILDDGFQHIALIRDMDIVLLDAKNPFGNGHLLPWGPLREPLSSLKRADAFILTRSGDASPVRDDYHMGNKPKYGSRHVPDRIIFPDSGKTCDPSFIRGKRVIAFSGIANPESFGETLLNLGTDVVCFRVFRDHHRYSQRDISMLRKDQKEFGADLLITTEKDWVRIRDKISKAASLAYLTIAFVFNSGGESFFKTIKTKADEVIDQLKG